jgi:hypothetical protein
MNRTKRRPSVEFLEARQALSGTSAALIVGILELSPQPAAKIPLTPVVVYHPQTPEIELTRPVESLSLN